MELTLIYQYLFEENRTQLKTPTMILTNDQIVEILTLRPNKNLLQAGSEQRKRCRMHMYGIGMAEHMTMSEGFEKPWLKEIRTKYVQSNKDLMSRLIKPITKVFTARGGSNYYNLTEDENNIAAQLEANVRQGMSVKKWMEAVWKYHLLDDPMGLIFMEIDERGKVYPTYKCVDDIAEYKLNGDRLEYVVFNVSKEDKKRMKLEDKAGVYRIVDDLFDRIVIWEGGQKIELPNVSVTPALTEVEGQTFVNFFGFVPGILNSPMVNPDGNGYLSPLYWVFDLADQFLLKISIRITHELRHGFPKYYEYGDDCIKCKGSGKFQAKDCPDCRGTGKKLMTAVSDVKILEWPGKDMQFLKGAPGGYIEPSKVFWDIVTAGLTELEERIYQTTWGSKTATKLKPGMGLSAGPNGIVTATEVMDNRQPEIECLNWYSDAAESRDKFITDCLIQVAMRKTDYIRKGGSSKNYGRRFLIEEPDTLLQRYTEARKNQISSSILYGMYEQYLESKYQSDPVSLSLYKKLLRIEPFMHLTLTELKACGGSPEDIRQKMFWPEWLVQQDTSTLLINGTQQLKDKFLSFVASKPLPVEQTVETGKTKQPAAA